MVARLNCIKAWVLTPTLNLAVYKSSMTRLQLGAVLLDGQADGRGGRVKLRKGLGTLTLTQHIVCGTPAAWRGPSRRAARRAWWPGRAARSLEFYTDPSIYLVQRACSLARSFSTGSPTGVVAGSGGEKADT